MPTDFPALVYQAIFQSQMSAIVAYNAGVKAGTIQGRIVQSGNVLDDRPAAGTAPGRIVSAMANRASADYPQIRLQIDGGGEMASPTPTFALAAGVPCDAILPEQVIVTQTVTYDGPKDADQTALEAYLKTYSKALYPKLGIVYCKGFTTTITRRVQKVDDQDRMVWKRRFVVDLWPHLATATT